ncbi:MAG: DNA/RNA non-specific endonuclease [Pyrinomonadaceae bacterium]
MRSNLEFQTRYVLYALVLALVFTGGCNWVSERIDSGNSNQSIDKSTIRPEAETVHLLLGNPSNADSGSRDNYLLLKRTFAISYNNSRGSANWISWKTTKKDLGDPLERPDFRPDLSLPRNFLRINATDYSGSGYQRGHLVPSADRFGDPEANLETFMMTNIVPQTGDLNQYPWEKFESYVRYNARRNSDVYQIAGVYGDRGRIRNKVTIPENCWKIVLILPAGAGIADVNENTLIIAVDMPNIKGIANNRWQQYQTTVRSIEQKTGYNFLDRLPKDLQEVLENRAADK